MIWDTNLLLPSVLLVLRSSDPNWNLYHWLPLFSAFGLGLNYTTNFRGFLVYREQIVELCGLHNCKSQFLIINIFLCTFFWFCFSRETYTLSYTLSRISSMWLCFPISYSPDYCNKFFLLVFLLPLLSHFITSKLYSVFLLCALSNIQACENGLVAYYASRTKSSCFV